ncbi:unnamed protein product [Caenorhabditis brenneri]
MEQYLKDPNNFPGYFTTENAFPILEAYVHKDVHDLFVAFEPTAFSAEFDRTKAAIYGKDLSDFKHELDSFRNFPGCLHKFGPLSRTYRTTVRKFVVGKGGKDPDTAVYKSDLFALMVQCLPIGSIISYGEYVVAAVEYYCAIYLRHKEAALLKGFNEFVDYEEAVFDRFKNDLVAACSKKIDEKKAKALKFADFRKNIKKAFHTIDPSLGPIADKWTTKLETNLSFSLHKSGYLWIQQYVTVFMTKAEAFINNHKDWFTLNNKFDRFRLFKNDETYFVLAKELYAEIRRSNYNGGEFERELLEEKDILRTLSWEEAEKKWKQFVKDAPSLDNIVKAHYEIFRTKHRAVFIPYCGNKHCILASDALLELMRTWFTVKGILQKITDQYRQLFIQCFFNKLYDFEPKFFSMDRQQFLDVNRVESINTWMETEMNGQFGPLLRSCKHITSFRGHIDFDDVVERLKQTNILFNFPIIQNFHKIVYSKYLERSKGKLTLCDVYGIYEQCQLLAFVATMPTLRHFFVSHGHAKMYPTDCIEYGYLFLESRQRFNKLHETDKEGWEEKQARIADITRKVAEARAKQTAQGLGLPPPGPQKIASGSDKMSDAARFNSPGYITNENIFPILKYYCDKTIYPLFILGDCDVEGDYKKTMIAYYADNTLDLYVHLDQFRGFPGSLKLCGFYSRTYRKKAIKHTFTPDTEGLPIINFWYKQDAYVLLFEQLYKNELDRQGLWTTVFIDFFSTIYLVYKEYQMLQYCDEYTTEIDMELLDRFRHHLSNTFDEEEANEMKELSFENTATALKKAIRNPFEIKHDGIIEEYVDAMMPLLKTEVDIKKHPKDYVTIVHHTTIFIREAEKFINDNIRWFKRDDVWKVTPRLFKHGNSKGFFIVSELVAALKKQKFNTHWFKEQKQYWMRDRLITISHARAHLIFYARNMTAEFGDFKVIPTEIIRTKHRCVPIPYGRKKHCIPVLDAFMEMLRKWVMRGIFQNLGVERSDKFRRLFLDTLAENDEKFKMIDPNNWTDHDRVWLNFQLSPALINIGWLAEIDSKLEALINAQFGDVLDKRVDVKPNDSDQFSYEELEKRAKDMGLFVTFPNTMGKYLEMVYGKFKSPGKVTTNDMYEMLENAQCLLFVDCDPVTKHWFQFNQFDVPVFPYNYDKYQARTNIFDHF